MRAEALLQRPILVVAIACGLSACAARPAPEPEVITPIATFAALPVEYDAKLRQPAPVRSRPPSGTYLPYTPYSPGVSPGAAAAGAGVGIVVIGIAALAKAERAEHQRKLDAAVAKLSLRPTEWLTTRLTERLAKASVQFEFIDDADKFSIPRVHNDLASVATDKDALLDIRITENGYNFSSWTNTYTPMLGVTVSMQIKATGKNESWSYWFDHRSRPKDRRWFTADPGLSLQSIEEIEKSASTIAEGFETAVDRIAAQLALDIKLRSEGHKIQ